MNAPDGTEFSKQVEEFLGGDVVAIVDCESVESHGVSKDNEARENGTNQPQILHEQNSLDFGSKFTTPIHISAEGFSWEALKCDL